MMRGYLNYHTAKWLLVVILLTTILILSVCACGTTPPATTLSSVTFPDANLETAIREAIDKPEGPISTSDLEAIILLDAPERGISDITGLEYCLNLEELWLQDNNISDISALAGLSNLELLFLAGNNISDISTLADLTSLKILSLWGNNISNISALIKNIGLSIGDSVNLKNNPLSVESIDYDIPQLEAKGVTVAY